MVYPIGKSDSCHVDTLSQMMWEAHAKWIPYHKWNKWLLPDGYRIPNGIGGSCQAGTLSQLVWVTHAIWIPYPNDIGSSYQTDTLSQMVVEAPTKLTPLFQIVIESHSQTPTQQNKITKSKRSVFAPGCQSTSGPLFPVDFVG